MKGYVCRGFPGSTDIPFDTMGFVVSDEILDGQYDTQSGTAPTADEAVDACCAALDSAAWTQIPHCYNNVANQDFTENLKPAIDRNYNALPLNTVYNTSGHSDIVIIVNDETLSTQYSWTQDGDCNLFLATPFGAGIYIINNDEINFTFTVLSSESITDGKFTFNTDQYYGSYNASIKRKVGPAPLFNVYWEWRTGSNVSKVHVPEAWLALNGASVYGDDTDPYSDDTDDSEPGGGDDDQRNWEGDGSNPEPDLPGLQATDAGFIQLFMPTITQLKSLANYMWSNLFDLDTFKKLFADPMDCILGLSIVPIDVTGSAQTVNVGNISTGISMNVASNQYKKIECGSIDIHEKLHSYLDYSPYRKIYLFLPYIGMRSLDIDMLNGTSLSVNYHVDILTGGCTAYVKVDNNVIDTFAGQCSMNVPITSRDWSSTIHGMISAATAIGGIASGGLTAPVTAASISGLATGAANVASTVMNSKPSYEKSGGIGSAAGILGMQKPYLILERPRLCKPSRQNEYMGYPGFITRSLGSLSGFTQVQDIRLSGLNATDTERNEILNLLRSGVIL